MAKTFRVTLETDEKAAYLLAVDDLPFEAVQHACKQVYRNETFMPVPAILRSYAKEWTKIMATKDEMVSTQQELLPEPQLLQQEVQALIASVWPDDRLKDPLPPHEEPQP